MVHLTVTNHTKSHNAFFAKAAQGIRAAALCLLSQQAHTRTCDDLERCFVYVVSDVVHAQVPQHHNTTEQQRGGVGQVLAGNVGRCAVHGLHQRQTVKACMYRTTAVCFCTEWCMTSPQHSVAGKHIEHAPLLQASQHL
jgi:hypothetical protein